MPVRRVRRRTRRSRPTAAASRSQRGPIVYCRRVARQPGRPRAQPRAAGRRAAHDRVPARPARRRHRSSRRAARAARTTRRARSSGASRTLTAIPYYAWANRGAGEMTVWLADASDAAARSPSPDARLAGRRSPSSGGTPAARDQRPGRARAASSDAATGYFHWWPKKGTTEWVEYDFAKPATRLGGRGLLVRRHRHRRVRVPGLVARPLPRRRGVEAGRAREPLRHGDGRASTAWPSRRSRRARCGSRSRCSPQWSAGIHEWTVE